MIIQKMELETIIHQFIAHNLKDKHHIPPKKSYELMKLLEQICSKNKDEENMAFKTLVKMFSENQSLAKISKEASKWGRVMKNYYFCKN